MLVTVHPRVHERHPDIAEEDVRWAWVHFTDAAVRVPGEREIRIGLDLRGRELEMVGVLTCSGWFVYHALIPPTKKTRDEIACARRRL